MFPDYWNEFKDLAALEDPLHADTADQMSDAGSAPAAPTESIPFALKDADMHQIVSLHRQALLARSGMPTFLTPACKI